MAFGDRTKQGIESWFTRKESPDRPSWGDRLSDWGLRMVGRGVTKAFEDMEPGAIEGYGPGLQKLIDDPNVPEDLKAFLRKAVTTGNPISAVGGMLIMALQAFGVLLGGSVPLSNILRYTQDAVLKTARLDPNSAITAWRRDPEEYSNVFQDLTDQGWDNSRIEALKFVTQFFPSPQDLISWIAKEVFEPDSIERYGLADEFGNLDLSLFEKGGVTPDQARNYWIAHWQHASFNQVVEMLYRGTMTQGKEPPEEPTNAAGWEARDQEGEAAMYEWYRLVEVPPFWRARLTNMAWNIPTRVDVRRWWEMRTITEQDLYSIYHRLGYHGKDLENYITWTKVYTDFPYWISRWTKGWVTEQEVRDWLASVGVPAEQIDIFIQDKVYPDAAERTAADRDVTRSDIFKGVKDERITRDQGIELLQELGYDEDEADYILAVNVPEDTTVSAVQNRQLTKSDVLNGLKLEVLTEDDARSKLLDLRYTPTDVQLLLDIFHASIDKPATETGRQESKTDVITAVKKGIITQQEGYLRLQDIGFTADAAEFILQVQTEESPFSPVTFGEFKDLTGKWRRSTGKEVTSMPAELTDKAAELVKAVNTVTLLQQQLKREQDKVINVPEVPPESDKAIKDLQVSLNRAIAERDRLQQEYDGAVAAWKASQGG